MSIIEGIRKYISGCPLLSEDEINVNYLGARSVSYTIDNIPASPIVRRYCDGGTLRQFCFVFASREAYDENMLMNMKVSEFFESFASWIEEQNNKKNLPEFDICGITPEKIEVTQSGYLFDTARTTARFQIQLRLLYRQEG